MKKQFKVRFVFWALLIAVMIPAAAQARARGWLVWWWLQPPTDPVPDTDFLGATVDNASLFFATASGWHLQSYQRVALDSTTTDANVSGGSISFPATIVLTNSAGDTADVTLNPAALSTNRFGSSFKATGTATITPVDTSISPATVSVKARGLIYNSDGTYTLKVSVRGVASSDAGGGMTNYTGICFTIRGTGTAVP